MKDIKIEGFSLTIEEGDAGSVKMSGVQCESFDYFESDFVKLARINVSTIFMTFKQQSPCTKYRLRKTQDTLEIQFMIALDFLPPFSESIVLRKIIGQEAKTKLVNNQIKAEIQGLETLISKFKYPNSRVQQKNQSFSANSGHIWEDFLKPGTHLLQLSGFVTSEYDYDNSYDQCPNYTNNVFPTIQVFIEEANQKRTVQKCIFSSGPQCSYQQPFSFSLLLTVKQEGKAYANFSASAAMVNNIYFSNIISSVTMISS